MNDFLRFNRTISPTALKGFFGSRLHGTFAILFNEIADATRQAVRLRVLTNDTPTDALPFLARQFAVPWLGTQSEASYRDSLRAIDSTTGAPGRIINDDGTIGADSEQVASGFWRRAVERGSPKSVNEALSRAGINGVVEEVADYDPAVPPFFRYRIRLPDFDLTDCDPYLYGEAPPYGSGWHYGTKLPFALVNTILAIAKFYGPARSKLEAIECGPPT